MKIVCVFLCVDVLARNCFLDLLVGGVFLRFLAAASASSVTLSHGGFFSWRKILSGMRGSTSIGGIVGDRIAMSFHVCGLGCSSAGDRENTRGDLVTSCLAGAAKSLV